MNDKQFLTFFIVVMIVCGGIIAYSYFKPQIQITGQQQPQPQQEETTTTQQQQPQQETVERHRQDVLYFTDYALVQDLPYPPECDRDAVAGGSLNDLKHEDGNYFTLCSTKDRGDFTWLTLVLYTDPCPWSNIIIVVTYYYDIPVHSAISLYFMDEYGDMHQYVLKKRTVDPTPTSPTRFEFHVTVTKGAVLQLEFLSDEDSGAIHYLYIDLAIVKQDTSASWLSFVMSGQGITIVCLAIVAIVLVIKCWRDRK